MGALPGLQQIVFRGVFVPATLLLPVLRSEAGAAAGNAPGGGGLCAG